MMVLLQSKQAKAINAFREGRLDEIGSQISNLECPYIGLAQPPLVER